MEECKHKAIVFNQTEMVFKCLIYGEDCVKIGGIIEYKLFCKFAGIDPENML